MKFNCIEFDNKYDALFNCNVVKAMLDPRWSFLVHMYRFKLDDNIEVNLYNWKIVIKYIQNNITEFCNYSWDGYLIEHCFTKDEKSPGVDNHRFQISGSRNYIGEYKEYWPNSYQLKTLRYYNDNGAPDGVIKTFFENGNIEKMYFDITSFKESGEYILYNESGSVLKHHYVHGNKSIKIEEAKTLFPNGRWFKSVI
jgi:hypothetical protein